MDIIWPNIITLLTGKVITTRYNAQNLYTYIQHFGGVCDRKQKKMCLYVYVIQKVVYTIKNNKAVYSKKE